MQLPEHQNLSVDRLGCVFINTTAMYNFYWFIFPEDNHNEIIFFGTSMSDVFIIDCIRSVEREQLAKEVSQMSELDFETSFVAREDSNAGIKEVTGIKRVRLLDRSIGDSLKLLYDFRCQMTGERIGTNTTPLSLKLTTLFLSLSP